MERNDIQVGGVVESVVESYGDRFADVVENAKLSMSITHVLKYVKDIANNDDRDIQAQDCVKMLESMKVNVQDAIGDAIA